jgi:hypothetical protein
VSRIIVNFFTEGFEEMALGRLTHKPLCWFPYIDHTFVISAHGPNRLRYFLNHLNSANHNTHLTMDTERDGHRLLLEIDIYRRPNDSGP